VKFWRPELGFLAVLAGLSVADAFDVVTPKPSLVPDQIVIQPGEVVELKQLAPPEQITGGVVFHRACSSCRIKDASIARITYLPSPECYLPADYTGTASEPCGMSANSFVEGLKEGSTTITGEIPSAVGSRVEVSASVRVTKDSPRLAVTSPSWGTVFVQGMPNHVEWRCTGCKPSDHVGIGVHSDEDGSSLVGTIANWQPASGAATWDARTVCDTSVFDPKEECYELRPGRYWTSGAVELDRSGMSRGPFASVAPFEIRSPDDERTNAITSDSISGAVAGVESDPPLGLWVSTAEGGKRLVCLGSSPAVLIPDQLSRSNQSGGASFTANDLVMRLDVLSIGVWRDAHLLTCDGSRKYSEAPPMLEAKEIRIVGSGLFGLELECGDVNRAETCAAAQNRYIVVEKFPTGLDRPVAQTGRGIGKFLVPLAPGHYFVEGQAFEVKASFWTRLDLRFAPPPGGSFH
jgi:hypothetical protein